MPNYWKDGDRRLIVRYCKGDDQRLKSSYRKYDDQRLMSCYRKMIVIGPHVLACNVADQRASPT